MNRDRRKELQKAFDLVGQAKEILETVKEAERESFDNLPDNFRYGEQGEEMEGYMEMLSEAWNYLDDANSVIEQI